MSYPDENYNEPAVTQGDADRADSLISGVKSFRNSIQPVLEAILHMHLGDFKADTDGLISGIDDFIVDYFARLEAEAQETLDRFGDGGYRDDVKNTYEGSR